MLAHLVVAMLALAASPSHAVEPSPDVQVRVDAGRREVVVTVGGIQIPPATSYHHHSETNRAFAWPVRGWARGYRLELLDAAGRPLPRDMLHHAGVIDLDRRQLAYPRLERLFAAGRETGPVMLPSSMGIPMATGQRLLLYYALVNESGRPVEGAAVRLTIAWTPPRSHPPCEIFPLFVDANPSPEPERSFDVPPGLSVTRAEFTLAVGGWLRAVGGHLHDHAVEIRLEDVQSGTVLVRLKARRQADGRIASVSSTRFPLQRRGLRLDAGHPYRVVALYDNPTAATIPMGAMAFMAGPFMPDDVKRWPALDSDDPMLAHDLASLYAEGLHSSPGAGHQ
jgi:hypothetical protein